MFKFGRAPEIDRIIDLEKFARWVHDKRTDKGLSLEVLARYITEAGYPISQNKLYRLEQHLKENGKRPLKTIDYELKIRLESVLGESFEQGEANEEMIPVTSVLELIKGMETKGKGTELVDNKPLREIQSAILQLMKAG